MKLKNVNILIDSREQVLKHITDAFIMNNIPFSVEKKENSLKVGDYSIQVEYEGKVIDFRDKIVIERKANLNELLNNLVHEEKDKEGYTRIEREFIRAKENNIKLILLIEDTYENLLKGNYRTDKKESRMNPAAFKGMLMAYKARYGFELIFTDKKMSASMIYNLLYYEAREYIKNLKLNSLNA